MDTRRYPSIPPLTLADDLSSTGTLIKTTTALGWNSETLTTAMFNTDYIPFTLINDSKTIVEFGLIDASTIANLTTTGATIYKRGLKYYSEGNSTDNDEVTANKFSWSQGETKLLIGTNPPKMYGDLTNKNNDETIVKPWTFDLTTGRPKLSSDVDTAVLEELIDFGQLSRTMASGAVDASNIAKGIVFTGSQAEVNAGDDTNPSGTAKNIVMPSTLASSILTANFISAADAGATDTYAITLPVSPVAYTVGQVFIFKANTANTGACSVNVNAIGALAIKKNHDQNLEDGDIEAGSWLIVVVESGTVCQLQTQQATIPTTAILSEMSTFFGTTDITGAEAETLTNDSNADLLHTHNISALLTSSSKYFIDFLTLSGAISTTTALGWITTESGSGSILNVAGSILTDALVGAGALGRAYVSCRIAGSNFLIFDATKDINLQVLATMSVGAHTNETFAIGLHDHSASLIALVDTEDHAKFIYDKGTAALAASSGNGTNQQSTAIAGITVSDENTYRIEFNAGVDVKFYVNGVLKATHATYIPNSGTALFPSFGADSPDNAGASGAVLVVADFASFVEVEI